MFESDDEDVREELYEYGLDFEYVDTNEGYFRYLLSTGGPGDEFRFYTNLNYQPYRIEYWFLDWFDGASITLDGEEFDLMENFFTDLFIESGICGSVVEEYQCQS